MDALDVKIVKELIGDARAPYARIATAVGVSTPTVHQRVRRLREQGIIRDSRVRLDWESVGLPVTALVSLVVGDRPMSEAAALLHDIPWIEACHAVTGEFDLLLVVRARSSTHLGEILEDVRRTIPGQSRTVVVLTTYFDGRVPPIDAG